MGPGVRGPWVPEERVMALLCGGGYAEYVAVPEELLLPVPLGLTLCQAAAVPEAWLTAYQLLHLVGNGYATMLTHPLGRRERLEQPTGDLWGHTRARPRTRTLRHARAQYRHTDAAATMHTHTHR